MATVVEGDFEREEEKAAENLAKHGVSFAQAATVFADPMAVYLDDGSGTERMVVIGMSLRERVLYGDTCRARRLRNRRLVMKAARHHDVEDAVEPVRVLGRGLRAQRGVRLTLRVLRDAAGKTQSDIAALTRINQADISRLEQRSDFDECQVATLRRYVEALGGALELVATFGEKRITVAGVSDEAAAQQGVPAAEARRDRIPSTKQRSGARVVPPSNSRVRGPRR